MEPIEACDIFKPMNPDLIEISGTRRWLLVTKQRNIESEL
jgi:hypothetical protein